MRFYTVLLKESRIIKKNKKQKTQFIRQFIILLASAVALMWFGGLAGRERGVGVPFLYNRLERA